jgi:L-2,4-diaminobutyrate transaminase
VALANLDIIQREDFVTQAREKGAYLLRNLKEALSNHPHVGEVRGLGLMCAIEYVKDKASKEEFKPEEKTGVRVHAAAQERGLFSRLRGDVFCLAPPIVTTQSQLDRIVEIMKGATEAVLGRK